MPRVRADSVAIMVLRLLRGTGITFVAYSPTPMRKSRLAKPYEERLAV
jgi:hypothetical protein